MCVRKKDKKKEAENKPASASLPASARVLKKNAASLLRNSLRVSA